MLPIVQFSIMYVCVWFLLLVFLPYESYFEGTVIFLLKVTIISVPITYLLFLFLPGEC